MAVCQHVVTGVCVILVIRRAGQDSGLIVRPLPNEHGRLIASSQALKACTNKGIEPPAPVIPIRGQMATLAAADDQIIPTVTVEVTPGNSGSKLAQFVRQ